MVSTVNRWPTWIWKISPARMASRASSTTGWYSPSGVRECACLGGAGSIVAIVSDHGFDTALYMVRPKAMLQAAKLSSAVQIKFGLIGVTDARAAAILRRSIGAPRSGIARELAMTEVRRLAPAAEVQGWVAAFDTTQGYIASDEEHGRPVSAANHKGVHGLWPTHDSSRALLILSGPGVRHARLPEISMLDLAPTFADILGIRLPNAKGTSILARPAR